jgi:hypothetical protein
MSTPVRGADGPLGYAPRWARAAGSGRADTAFDSRARSATPVQELPQDLKPPRIATSPREAVSGRDAPGRDLISARETAPLSDDAAFELDIEPPAEPASRWETKPSRAPASSPASAPDTLWKRKKRPVVFEGDAALRELRSRLASAPDQAPEPPMYQVKTPIFAAVVRLVGVMILAAVGALGFLWITSPRGVPPQQVASKGGSTDIGSVSYRGFAVQPGPPSAAEAARRAPDAPPGGSPWAAANYNVTDGVVDTPAATLAPRAPASRTTMPSPAAPAPAATAPTPPLVVPPPADAAPMPPPVAPTPVAAPPPAASAPTPKAPPAIAAPISAPPPPTSTVASPDRDEVATLLARARTYLATGDVAAARVVLRRAAERDDPQAALALGGTYDPIVLKRLGIVNLRADPTQAREWYRRAVQLGSADASLRLEQLVQTGH